jgi:hypothetical protein
MSSWSPKSWQVSAVLAVAEAEVGRLVEPNILRQASAIKGNTITHTHKRPGIVAHSYNPI